jgi:uncharacterized protein (DUF433 family)
MEYGAVNIDQEVMGGTPVFIGTRVPVKTLFDYLEGGDTLEEFLDDFPSVSKSDALHVIAIAKEIRGDYSKDKELVAFTEIDFDKFHEAL